MTTPKPTRNGNGNGNGKKGFGATLSEQTPMSLALVLIIVAATAKILLDFSDVRSQIRLTQKDMTNGFKQVSERADRMGDDIQKGFDQINAHLLKVENRDVLLTKDFRHWLELFRTANDPSKLKVPEFR